MKSLKNIACYFCILLITSCVSNFKVVNMSVDLPASDRQELGEYIEVFLLNEGYQLCPSFGNVHLYSKTYYHSDMIGRNYSYLRKDKGYPGITLNTGERVIVSYINDSVKEPEYAQDMRSKLEISIRNNFKNAKIKTTSIVQKRHFLDP